MLIGLGLPSPITIFFNNRIGVLLPKVNRSPGLYDYDYDENHYNALKLRQAG